MIEVNENMATNDRLSRKLDLMKEMGLLNSSIIIHQSQLQYLIKKYTEYQSEYNNIVAEELENGTTLPTK